MSAFTGCASWSDHDMITCASTGSCVRVWGWWNWSTTTVRPANPSRISRGLRLSGVVLEECNRLDVQKQ